jgi:hypothetical protein
MEYMKQYDFGASDLPSENPKQDLETISNSYFGPLMRERKGSQT